MSMWEATCKADIERGANGPNVHFGAKMTADNAPHLDVCVVCKPAHKTARVGKGIFNRLEQGFARLKLHTQARGRHGGRRTGALRFKSTKC